MRTDVTFCLTDESARLSAASLLPIVRAFAKICDVTVTAADVSLAGRVLSTMLDGARHGQAFPDELGRLVNLLSSGRANIVKPPSMSASPLQLKTAISELRHQGFHLPDYPDLVSSAAEEEVRSNYDAVLGSAVNVALRRGNVERSVPAFARRRNPVLPDQLRQWSQSRSQVATMRKGDFRTTEQATTISRDGELRVEHVDSLGVKNVLGGTVRIRSKDVVDCATMNRVSLRRFLDRELESAQREDLLVSLQLKCTTMRVADPLVFACAVRAYLERHLGSRGFALNGLVASLDKGLGTVGAAVDLDSIPEELRRALEGLVAESPSLSFERPGGGESSLHEPGGTSIAASMAAAIKRSGRMFDSRGRLRDTKFVIPDHSYTAFFDEILRDHRCRGPLDSASMGSIRIAGLSADAAEEYGSNATTFEINSPGHVQVTNQHGEVLFRHPVERGDVWRLCRTSHATIADWLALGLEIARREGMVAVIWLDRARPRDREQLKKLPELVDGSRSENPQVRVLNVSDATSETLQLLRKGTDVVAVVGNVLRDYLSEFVAMEEAGNSLFLQSTTLLPVGGAVFEAGAGGSAPLVAKDFYETNHLRWNSMGEVGALISSFQLVARTDENCLAGALAAGLARAATQLMKDDRLPRRSTGELDTRGSHFYLAYHWASEMANAPEVGPRFAGIARKLLERARVIEEELLAIQGAPAALDGYFRPDPDMLSKTMCPSTSFNEVLREL